MTRTKLFSKIANNYPSYQEINGVKLNAYKYIHFRFRETIVILHKVLFDGLFRWLQSRQKDDNAEELWRVHDTLYDLTDFINWHPGGVDWIKLTKVRCGSQRIDYLLLFIRLITLRLFNLKGTDITEAFEIHHFNRVKVGHLLQTYRVREAKLPRNFKFTFKETGFYRTLQHRIAEELKQIDPKQDEFLSKVCKLFHS